MHYLIIAISIVFFYWVEEFCIQFVRHGSTFLAIVTSSILCIILDVNTLPVCLYFHTKVQKYLHTFYATLVNFRHSPEMWGKRRACIVITILINMNNLHSPIVVVQRYKWFKCTQVQVNCVVNTSVHIVTTEYLTCGMHLQSLNDIAAYSEGKFTFKQK